MISQNTANLGRHAAMLTAGRPANLLLKLTNQYTALKADRPCIQATLNKHKLHSAIQSQNGIAVTGILSFLAGERISVLLMKGKSSAASSAEATEEISFLERSIERSRKRHLSEGLLRGDQALDRLRLQESSASPLLKKTRSNDPASPSSRALLLPYWKPGYGP